MNMEQTDDGIIIHQGHYIRTCLNHHQLTNLPPRRTPLPPDTRLVPNPGRATKDDIAYYAALVGSMNWLANQTRFDIAHSTSLLSRFTSNPSQTHIDSAHHVWGYLQTTEHYGILFQRTGSLHLFRYTDSDYAMCPETRRSTIGWFINDLNVARSIEKVPLYMDNNAVEHLSQNPKFHQRIKHIEVQYNFLRKRVTQEKDISTIRIDSKDNIADMFTKSLSRPHLVYKPNTHAIQKASVRQNLTVHVFVAGADHDTVGLEQAPTAAKLIGAEATFHLFQSNTGAGEHCQIGAESQLGLTLYDWVAKVVG
ncbi:hypothetical protein LA080_002481 [Diaporthe eres]|nr:hypothetical protein LA080_002481 [Diaporthe eres]